MAKTFDKKPWDKLSKLEIASFVDALDKTAFAPLSREIGRFAMAWAHLDQAISLLLRAVCKSPDAFEFAVLSGQLDIYGKCRALVALSGRGIRPKGWHDDLSRLCKQIEGPYREERNRIAHDTWLAGDQGYSRLFWPTRQQRWSTAIRR